MLGIEATNSISSIAGILIGYFVDKNIFHHKGIKRIINSINQSFIFIGYLKYRFRKGKKLDDFNLFFMMPTVIIRRKKDIGEKCREDIKMDFQGIL
jgi:hypothetical protein